MLSLLHQAAEIALPSIPNDMRTYWIGCVGVRKDGTIVSAKNGAVEFHQTIALHQLLPNSHAEGRVLRKLGYGGDLYVARMGRSKKELKCAQPCCMCQNRIMSQGVRRVYYSINNKQYGIWDVKKDHHEVRYF